MGISLSSGIRIPVYSCADAAALAALTTMQTGDLCLQLDTKVWYFYDGATWSKVADTTAAAGSSLVLIDTKTAGAADATLSFTSIPAYDSYIIEFIGANSNAAGDTDNTFRINNDSGNHYYSKFIKHIDTTVSADSAAVASSGIFSMHRQTMAFDEGYARFHLRGGTRVYHEWDTQTGCRDYSSGVYSGQYTTGGAAAAVTQIDLISGSGNWKQYSKAILYGVKSA